MRRQLRPDIAVCFIRIFHGRRQTEKTEAAARWATTSENLATPATLRKYRMNTKAGKNTDPCGRDGQHGIAVISAFSDAVSNFPHMVGRADRARDIPNCSVNSGSPGGDGSGSRFYHKGVIYWMTGAITVYLEMLPAS